MRLAGVIIAGGQSRRMGHEKALLEFGGVSLIARIADRLRPQVAALAINANGDARRFEFLGLPVIADCTTSASPLAGLLTALTWANDNAFDAVITAPSDTPFLPHDFFERLHGDGAAIAASGQPHYICGFWPVTLLPILDDALRHHDMRRMKDWTTLCAARIVLWPVAPYDPFFNINTADDLATAALIARACPDA